MVSDLPTNSTFCGAFLSGRQYCFLSTVEQDE